MANKASKKSKIWKLEKPEIQKLFDTHHSICDILKEIGLNAYNGNHRTLHRRVLLDNLDLTKFNINKDVWRKDHLRIARKLRSFDDIFVEDSSYNSNKSLKNHLFKLDIVEHRCALCGNIGQHNHKPLSLQLDHINGISNDNRVENLRLLCPNCHSQTDTFAGKRNKIVYKCETCKSTITKNSTKCRLCQSHSRKGVNTLEWPSVEVVVDMVKSSSFVKVGEILQRSDNSIRKFLARNDIDPKTLSNF